MAFETVKFDLLAKGAWSGKVAQTGLNSLSLQQSNDASQSLSFGTGAGAVNFVYDVVTELAASAVTTIDLAALTEISSSVGFSAVKLLMLDIVENADASTQATSIKVEPGAANGWEGFWLGGTVPGSTIYSAGPPYLGGNWSAGGKVVDGTHKTLKITNNDGTNKATFRLQVAGLKA